MSGAVPALDRHMSNNSDPFDRLTLSPRTRSPKPDFKQTENR